MKQKSTLWLLTVALALFQSLVWGQSYQPSTLVFGTSPFQDSLWAFDTTASWAVVQRTAPSLAGFTITGINGLALDPCTNTTYAILKVSGVSGRVLATMDPYSGVCTQVGNLGANFSSIAFDRNGQLYGLTGDGATPPETFFSIDKATANKTQLTPLGNGADGEVMAYHPVTDKLFHWSGNGTVVYEKFLPVSPFTVTAIAPSLGTGEVFGACYINPNQFLISTINSNFRYVDTLGNVSAALTSTPDDIRGTIIPPRFGFSEDTVCPFYDTLFVGATGVHLHTVIYQWGDGSSDTIASGGASHIYTTQGNKTLRILLDNGFCVDTFLTQTIRVNNAPVVGITGDRSLCPSDTNTLVGTSGGSSQWYRNGVLIPGATLNSLDVSTAGTYNMLKTNQNGCRDSAAIGFEVINVPAPTVNLGGAQSDCESVSLDAGNAGATYVWTGGQTTQSISATVSGTYVVVVADSNGCEGTDSAAVTIFGLPAVTYNESQNLLCDTAAAITLTPGTPAGGTYAGAGVSGTQFDPSVTGVGSFSVSYTYTDGNGCTNSDTSDIEVVVCLGMAENLADLGISLFPQPASQRVHLLLTHAAEGTASVYSLDGRVLGTSTFQGLTCDLDISTMPTGLYLVRITIDDRQATIPLSVQR